MRIFISGVSGQFKACRDQVASDLRAVGAEVAVQEDFQQHGRTLLEKLEEYVAGCDRVIALVGDAYGWEPEPAALTLGTPRRSYTQWEYFFAQGEAARIATRLVPFTKFAPWCFGMGSVWPSASVRHRTCPTLPWERFSKVAAPRTSPCSAFSLTLRLTRFLTLCWRRRKLRAFSSTLLFSFRQTRRKPPARPTRVGTRWLRWPTTAWVKWDTQEELVTVHRVVRDWNLLPPHVAFAVAQADAEGISAPTSVLMGELGVLLHFQALYAEAEPLMRRVVVILVNFTRNTGHEHPHLRLVFGNYAQLLAEMALPEGEVQARWKSPLSGPEGPELDP